MPDVPPASIRSSVLRSLKVDTGSLNVYFLFDDMVVSRVFKEVLEFVNRVIRGPEDMYREVVGEREEKERDVGIVEPRVVRNRGFL
eukprot:CAMPEP_0118661248 /NCGR_PEP_ID=MMETSP0785-20121206/16172_1 /TAXON_ID=91992 /ORGANISM="Bolidomonas pacifica, Strain CCMP 1866" /LENGTH=85 /DNA_ID=CAMNT_0006554663 /DNA_START=74 /DNA_END=331 /DNA_ORIENTATION=+